ncbi:MAG: YHS domain-containing protein [Dehalococcoidia bacterium]
MAMVKDPVCGMEIDSETAAGSSEYEGTTYYFCSEGCKHDFDTSPWKYVGTGAGLAEAMGKPSDMPASSAEPAAAKAKKWWEFWK